MEAADRAEADLEEEDPEEAVSEDLPTEEWEDRRTDRFAEVFTDDPDITGEVASAV